MMNDADKRCIREVFDTMVRADYISIDNMEALDKLDDYYIDSFNVVGSVLQRQDNYVMGRRGSGKTTLLFKSYYECMKTVCKQIKKESKFFGDRKVLPIYIDLSKCEELFNDNNAEQLIESNFVMQIIKAFRSQIEILYEKSFIQKFKIDNEALEDLQYIERLVIDGQIVKKSRDNLISNKINDDVSKKVNAHMSMDGISLESNYGKTNQHCVETQYSQIRGIDINTFLNWIKTVKNKTDIDDIYLFIDEYSDLDQEKQIIISKLLKKLLGSKINLYIKIGVITDRFKFDEKIIIGRDLFEISLDLNDFVERYGGIVATLKHMQQFMEALITQRIKLFSKELKLDDILKNDKEDLLQRVLYASMGVPRTIGLIFQTAWNQTDALMNNKDNKIGIKEVNYAINAVRKMQYKQFAGAVKAHAIPAFYMDFWNEILNKALTEKNKFPDRPASHIMIDPCKKNYMNIFCENYMLHLLEDDRTSKYGGVYSLYCINYDVCNELNIKFATVKDEFTAIRFIYNSVLEKYDPYFSNDRLKSYKCPYCGKIYSEQEVAYIKVKRCFEDDTLLEEIIHKSSPITKGNYAEVEVKILGLITELNEEEALSAREIADIVGCSLQKVSSWCSRVLKSKNMININNIGGRNMYYGNKDYDYEDNQKRE